MSVVQLEHPIRDFESWKDAFDRDPVRREESGVRRYRIFRPVDDPEYVAVDLEFDDRTTAEAFKLALEELWRSPHATSVLGGAPRVRVVEVVESKAY
ncbi:MAG: hypothetical protein ACYDAK_08370 [Candidatus Limnocylindrales bacterium]